ncbi:hypothetical protein P3X46_019051 [Hevea brasiliensis]|uniref:Serine/arginine repetitive matrix protein 1-like n=1 Tax=Hevea brasiliensis TaxID=3981 RepID=A0ABQ9LSL3_HEVBR|nr:uncharacterized protein LOC110668208 [Hevea brasiliensis]KAJ9170996.1 hypothetical protein P3X46_019051 [Hevea brasiliensis]
MGCCMSSRAVREPHQPKAPDYHRPPPKRPAPEPKSSHVPITSLDEETVKEVLSETPIPKVPQMSPSPQQKNTQNPVVYEPKSQENKRKEEKEEEVERTPEISQASEICSVTNTYSTATTATTATAVTEIRDDEVTSKKRVNRSPSKLPRKRPYNGERERGIKPPGKRELSSQATTTQRNVGSSRVGRDLGERSARRSRSPATRKTSGGVSRGGRAGGSPANVTGKSGGRRGEAGSGVKKEEKREENDSVLMQQQQGNEPVSLENPLLSFECFIFV